MLPKPESCKGCPLYGNGRGYVPDIQQDGAAIFIVGQNPGFEEEEWGQPFIGKTGQSMETYLKLAGFSRGDVSIGNAIRCRWQNSNELPELGKKEQLVEKAIAYCTQAHFRLPSGTKLFIAQGAYALYALTGETGVTDWRGYLLPLQFTNVRQSVLRSVWTPLLHEIPVLATVHLAAIFRSSVLAQPTRMDWLKVPRVLKGEWPRKPPEWSTETPWAWPRVSAFDTEFDPVTGILDRYSLYDGEQLYVVESIQDQTGEGDRKSHAHVEMPNDATVYMYNIEADILRLKALLGRAPANLEDPMLMDAVLWTDRPHDLNFLGSLYATINRWKHLAWMERGKFVSVNPQQYSGMDAVGTWDVGMALEMQMQQDPLSEWVYKNAVLPLTPIIMEAESEGLPLNHQRVDQALEHFQSQARRLNLQAQASVGWPMNLGSNEHVSHQLYTIEKVGKRRETRRK